MSKGLLKDLLRMLQDLIWAVRSVCRLFIDFQRIYEEVYGGL